MTLEARYTTDSGPGDSDGQAYPSHSLGGYASRTPWGGGVVSDLFGRVSSVDASTGRKDYRCVYLYNAGADLSDLRVYVAPVTAGGVVDVGADPRPVTHVDSLSPQAVDADTAYTAPYGVAFTAPADYASGVSLGDLPGPTATVSGAGRALWLRRTPSYTAGLQAEACDLTAADSTGVLWTRRVYWQVEPAPAPGLSPPAPQRTAAAVSTPSPFIRVAADFLSETGARVTWDLDATLQDDGPYHFQLQVSMSGVPAGADWADVGPPSEDAVYLVDTTARLWGSSTTLFYRVVLTTASASYTSPVANAYGSLSRRDWLDVREILRKERLYQREFVGTAGFILKARRYGTRCSCVGQTDGEINNSSCGICYGLGIVGGYHEPIASTFATRSPESSKERVAYNESLGTVRPVTVTGRMVADVPVLSRDAWVGVGSDVRYYVHTVGEAAAWQGVPVVYLVELKLAPRSDILYTFPVDRPDNDCPDWRTTVRMEL